MRRVLLSVVLTLVALPLAAQQSELKRPAEWKVRFDQAGADESQLYFVSMPPGWHITTGPSVILYDPAKVAGGQYRVESEMFLFDPKGRNREGYGLFIGGRDLEGDGQAYTYFLLRNDGRFLIKRRKGAETPVVTDWTEHPAIAKHAGGPDAPNAKNVLAVEVGPAAVDFFVNGQKVATVPKTDVDTDGLVGLRVNHAVNLHVTTLDVKR